MLHWETNRFYHRPFLLTPSATRAIFFVEENIALTIITLMTDFGLKDGNVGVMKGVIAGIAPQAQVIDISHLIPPQDIPEAALIFLRSAKYFPDGTIHVVVVDPGVGTSRRPMAARLGSQYYVGPDNGTLTMLLERCDGLGAEAVFYHLDRPNLSGTGFEFLARAVVLLEPPSWELGIKRLQEQACRRDRQCIPLYLPRRWGSY